MMIQNTDIQVYTYNGTLVFLADMDDLPNVEPIATDGAGIGAYRLDDYNGCDVCVTIDDSYSCNSDDGTPIVAEYCTNPENDQTLLCAWWTADYYNNDFFRREFLTTTNNYHRWESARTRMLRQIVNASNDGMLAAADSSRLKAEWDRDIESLSENCTEYTASDAPLGELLQEARVHVE